MGVSAVTISMKIMLFVLITMLVASAAFAPIMDGTRSWTHSGALEHCRDQGYDLVSIHNENQDEIINDMCRGLGYCWIGLVLHNITNKWSWTDGTALDYGFDDDGNPTTGVGPWKSGEPNRSKINALYVVIVNGNGWDDYWDEGGDLLVLCNNATLGPAMDPTTDPTNDPTSGPTIDPTSEPTHEPTTMCHPYENCMDCLSMNPDGFTQCLWHSGNQECTLTHQIDDHNFAITDEASCPIVNELCDNSTWNEVSGDWEFDSKDCSLYSTGGSLPNNNNKGIVWFGSADGQTPNNKYCHSYFELGVSVVFHSGDRFGISFRSETSNITYYLRFNPSTGYINIFQLDDDSTIENIAPLYITDAGIGYNSTYNVTVIAKLTVYDIYLNEVFLGSYLLTNLTNYDNCSIGIKASYSKATFLSLTYNGVDTVSPTNAPNSSPTYMPTSFLTDPTSEPSDLPTSSPSDAPTDTPSQSPTRYPISILDFDSAVNAIYNISGWTYDEISVVNKDWESFASSLTDYIHQGFDVDPDLEFRYILPNISLINDHTVDELSTMERKGSILWEIIANGMTLQYLIECSTYIHCVYVAESDPSVGMNRAALEEFVSAKVNMYFTSTDTDVEGADPSLMFTVKDMTLMNDGINDTSEATSTDTSTSMWILGGILVILFCGLLLGIYYIYWKYRKRANSLSISNALVAMISIGDYSDGSKISRRDKDVHATLINLPVEKDAETLRGLCGFMNWTFISKGKKVHWTEKEVMHFLQSEIPEMMFSANNEMKFDGLIVCVSCHGMKDKIVTSDFKTIEKRVIHRVLSLKYPKLREIPRIFLFDCCDGSDDRRATIELNEELSKEIELMRMEQNKNTDLNDVQNLNVNAWTSTTKNPDYNLVEVYAANSGFVAKMNNIGSYLVYYVTEAIKRNEEKKEGKALSEILEDVQNRLHDAGRQQTVNILNNHTRTLVFHKCKRA